MELSERLGKVSGCHILAQAHFRCAEHPYSAKDNPDGYINLGTAEHAWMIPRMHRFLQNAPVAEEKDLHYQCLHGQESVRKAFAQWLSPRAGRALDPEKVVLSAGATSQIEALGFALCDPGEVMLIPAPFYSGFSYDLKMRAGVKVEPLPCYPEEGFELKVERLIETVHKLRQEGDTVKALLIHNPTNPTGLIIDEETLKALSAACLKLDIHLVVDEICADTVFGSQPFYSALNLTDSHVHTLYSVGKGLALAGLSTGAFYSENNDLVQVMASQAYFARLANNVQTQLAWLLEQPEVPQLLKDSCSFLKETTLHLIDALEPLGVEVLKPQAGVFLWLNLGKVFDVKTFEDELALFERLMSEPRVNLSPGQYFECPAPGWFRICYSVPEATLKEGIKRLSLFINSEIKNRR